MSAQPKQIEETHTESGSDDSSTANSSMADPIMDAIMAGGLLLHRGDKAGARRELEAVWSRIAIDCQPMHEVALAHTLADAQDNPADELTWDLRALNAALRCTDDDARRHSQMKTIAGFMPSLHINLAEDYLKLGDRPRARNHLASARAFIDELSDDGYGRMIRMGIERVERELV